ncbi:MAG TPA: hypothetical protein VHB73_01805 [Alphaproteobacteria bacterium]|nr:hypothetical protein [Alphaproteobacteria bacterium]
MPKVLPNHKNKERELIFENACMHNNFDDMDANDRLLATQFYGALEYAANAKPWHFFNNPHLHLISLLHQVLGWHANEVMKAELRAAGRIMAEGPFSSPPPFEKQFRKLAYLAAEALENEFPNHQAIANMPDKELVELRDKMVGKNHDLLIIKMRDAVGMNVDYPSMRKLIADAEKEKLIAALKSSLRDDPAGFYARRLIAQKLSNLTGHPYTIFEEAQACMEKMIGYVFEIGGGGPHATDARQAKARRAEAGYPFCRRFLLDQKAALDMPLRPNFPFWISDPKNSSPSVFSWWASRRWKPFARPGI